MWEYSPGNIRHPDLYFILECYRHCHGFTAHCIPCKYSSGSSHNRCLHHGAWCWRDGMGCGWQLAWWAPSLCSGTVYQCALSLHTATWCWSFSLFLPVSILIFTWLALTIFWILVLFLTFLLTQINARNLQSSQRSEISIDGWIDGQQIDCLLRNIYWRRCVFIHLNKPT